MAVSIRRAAHLAAAIAAFVALPATASAKLSCDDRGPRGGVVLRGLPPQPVAGRAYGVEAHVPGGRSDVVNAAPALGRFQCFGTRSERATPAHWIQPTDDPDLDAQAGDYAYRVRFPRPGDWRLEILDRRGRYRDLGQRRVVAAAQPATNHASAGLVAAAILALIGGGAVLARPRIRGRPG
jgi:hypothetical protein